MKSNNQTLGAILYSPNQYVIPVFQRYYRWREQQWEKLWTDLLSLRRPEKTGHHFLGFLVLIPDTPQPGNVTTFHVIDGQQRLTTLSLILAALRNVVQVVGDEDLAREIDETYLVHPHRHGPERLRLYLKEAIATTMPRRSAMRGRRLVASATRWRTSAIDFESCSHHPHAPRVNSSVS